MPTPQSPIHLDKIGERIMHNPRTKAQREKMRDVELAQLSLPQNDWERRLFAGHVHRLLNLATSEARLERVHQLLKAGAPVMVDGEADDQEGWTLLHHMVEGEVLDSSGANLHELGRVLEYPSVRKALNHCTMRGDTALMFAIQSRFDVVAVCLLQAGARLDGSKETEHTYPSGPRPVEWKLICDHLDHLGQTARVYAPLLNAEDAAVPSEAARVLMERLDYLCEHIRTRTSTPEAAATNLSILEILLDALSPQMAQYDENYDDKLLRNAARTLNWIAIERDGEDLSIDIKAPLAVKMLDAFHRAGLDVWSDGAKETWRSLTQGLGSAHLLSYLENARLEHATQPSAKPALRHKRL
jgi:hypothetical protein